MLRQVVADFVKKNNNLFAVLNIIPQRIWAFLTSCRELFHRSAEHIFAYVDLALDFIYY